MHRRQFIASTLAGAAGLCPAVWASAAAFTFHLGVISDEADARLEHVLRDFLPHYHLRWVELRGVRFGRRNVYLSTHGTAAEVRQVKQQLDRAGMRLSVLDTGIYKIPLPGTRAHASRADLNQVRARYRNQMEYLKHAAGVAHALGTKKVRIFTFLRVAHPATVFDRVVEEMHKALAVAAQEDIELVIENEFDTNIATGAETARFFRAIPDRRLCHNWDPGNCFAIGDEPYPQAWNQLDHSRICHIHLKDAVRLPNGRTRWMPVGKGSIDFRGQFRALKAMRYTDTMSLETHYRNARHDPWTSSMESMDGILRLIHRTGARAD